MNSKTRNWALVAIAAFFFGAVFASLSTLDFTEHLDRELHSLHCSFIPGMPSEGMGEAGCRAVMNSRFSSLFRDSYWGGVPIALLALAVFAYLFFLTTEMAVRSRIERRGEAGYLFLASLLPVGMSLVFFTIAATELHAFCKLCIGIYVSSGLYCLAAFMLWQNGIPHLQRSRGLLYFGEGVLFVAAAIVIYVMALPDYTSKVTSCGGLKKPEDKQKVLMTIATGSSSALEIIDPLCPACKAFETRIADDHLLDGTQRQILLFPLDSECNWMLSQSMHPGACMVSRAFLCAENDIQAMMKYVFDNQEEFRIIASKAPDEIKQKLEQKFPRITACIDTAETKMRLNNMLRYAMNNRIPITTPQLYLGAKRLCDEDSDLGLDYSIGVLKSEALASKGSK